MQEKRPHCEWIHDQLSKAREHVIHVQDARSEYFFHKVAAHWCQVGNKVIKEFFNATGPNHNKFHVMYLERSDGS